MDDRVLSAIENNAAWCDLVCRSHGIPTTMRPRLWAALRRSPRLYPDAVTMVPAATAQDVLRTVQAGVGCSVKDSFSSLDLGQFGFAELFEARWIHCEPVDPARRCNLDWSVIADAHSLAEWTRAAGIAHAIRRDLLRDSTVRFLAVRGPDGLSAGAIANRSGSVVGVSNVFSETTSAEETWAGLATAVAGVFPSLPIVGYEHGAGLKASVAGGFDEIGPLRIWQLTGEPVTGP